MWYDRILSKSFRKHLFAIQLLKCGSTLIFEEFLIVFSTVFFI